MRNSSIGSYIRTCRIGRGLTQKALADQLHVTDKAVSKWERDLSIPDIRLFPALAEALNVTISDLIREFYDDSSPADLREHYEVSSDLRTPLHIILGCTDLLEVYHDDPARFDRYLQAIRVSGEYLLSALNIKDHSRGQAIDGSDAFSRHNSPSREIAQPVYDFTSSRILIAEDIEINREIVSEILRPTGALLEFASNGRICVDLVEMNPPGYYDLILMDLVMPEMDGLEATRCIRLMEDPDKAIIPIIAMTANVRDIDRNAAFDAGMNAFTEKPIHSDKLYSTMHQFL